MSPDQSLLYSTTVLYDVIYTHTHTVKPPTSGQCGTEGCP